MAQEVRAARVQRCVERCARHWQSRVLLAHASAAAAAKGEGGGGEAVGGVGVVRDTHGARYAGIWEGVGPTGFGVYLYKIMLIQPLPPHLEKGFYETWKLPCVPLPRHCLCRMPEKSGYAAWRRRDSLTTEGLCFCFQDDVLNRTLFMSARS